jgi:carboxypeptidase Taq
VKSKKAGRNGEVLPRLKALDGELRRLGHISALLAWDQETYMPSEAVGERSEQLELLSGLIHDRLTSREVGGLMAAAGLGEASPSGPGGLASPLEQAFLRELYRLYRRASRLPRRLVTELAKQTAIGQARWAEARKASDFRIFSAQLAAILALVKESASCLGWQDHPYDPLLDEYEPWMKTAEVERVFSGLGPRLTGLVERIVGSRRKPSKSFLNNGYEVEKQRVFSLRLLSAIGYDFQRGRLDESAHPFTTTLGRADVRLTTRYNPGFIASGIFGTIHEAGHGLYELGFGEELLGTLLADGTSMGIHESQSRMWENLIGRSLPFWRFFFPELQAQFPAALAGIGVEEFYRGINAVEPSLIRVEADEVTYTLHILARFELEKRLIAGELGVADLPSAWNEQYQSLLGIVPPDDAHGVLQDIHWSMGSFGYFPTYALGNLYAAQLFQAMRRDLPELDGHMLRGQFAPILAWLREKVHRVGRTVPAAELCRQVTGRDLDPGCLLEYLETKYAGIYEL